LSGAGLGTSILAAILAAWGFTLSPTLWFIAGVGLLTHSATSPQTPNQLALESHVSAPATAPSNQSRDATMANVMAQIGDLISKEEQFNSIADSYATRLDEANQRYLAITSRLEQLFANTPRMPNNAGLYGAWGDGHRATNEIHNEIQRTKQEFGDKLRPLIQKIADFSLACHQFDLSSPSDPRKANCSKLAIASAAFQKNYNAILSKFLRLDSTYVNVIARQDDLYRQ
jgi:hypothetical protein